MAVLTKSLARLRTDFNTVAPGRDKASDGWIGDAAHAAGVSGHNAESSGKSESRDGDPIDEVRALDVDDDFRVPGLTMLKIIQKILATPNDLKRLRYIIYNRVIWSKSNGWHARAYNGPNAHTEHAHFSGDLNYDDNVTPWSVLTWKAVPVADSPLVVDMAWRVDGSLVRGLDVTAGGPSKGQAIWIVRQVKDIVARLVRIEAKPSVVIDQAALNAAVQAGIAAALPAALAMALGNVELKIEKAD